MSLRMGDVDGLQDAKSNTDQTSTQVTAAPTDKPRLLDSCFHAPSTSAAMLTPTPSPSPSPPAAAAASTGAAMINPSPVPPLPLQWSLQMQKASSHETDATATRSPSPSSSSSDSYSDYTLTDMASQLSRQYGRRGRNTMDDGEDGTMSTRARKKSSSRSRRAGRVGTGHPYEPLGEPLLDFVFPVKRRQPNRSSHPYYYSTSYGARSDTHGYNNDRRHQINERRVMFGDQRTAAPFVSGNMDEPIGSGVDGASSSSSVTSSSSSSLSHFDPLRDLLSHCTPRRGDTLESDSLLTARIKSSDNRRHMAKAKGTGMARPSPSSQHGGAHTALATLGTGHSTKNTARGQSGHGVNGDGDGVDEIRLQLDLLAAAQHLVQRAVKDQREEIDRAIKERNRLRMEREKNEIGMKHRDRPAEEEEMNRVLSSLLASPLPSSCLPPSILNLPSSSPAAAIFARALTRAEHSLLQRCLADGSLSVHSDTGLLRRIHQRLCAATNDGSTSGRAITSFFPINFSKNEFYHMPPHPLFDTHTRTRQENWKQQHQQHQHQYERGEGEGEGVAHASASASARHPPLRWGGTAVEVEEKQEQEQQSMGVHRRHPTKTSAVSPASISVHPPNQPSLLTFHHLRYTLHHSYDTHLMAAAEQMEQARKEKERRMRQQVGSSTARHRRQMQPMPPQHPRNGSSIFNLTEVPLSGSHSARTSSSDRARSRPSAPLSSRSLTSTSSSPLSSAYHRAVASSRFRRDLASSDPRSHWMRLVENISQRAAQLQAATNSDYMNPLGPVGMRGVSEAEDDQEEEAKMSIASQRRSNPAASPSIPLHAPPSSSFGKGQYGQQILRQVTNPTFTSFFTPPGSTVNKDGDDEGPSTTHGLASSLSSPSSSSCFLPTAALRASLMLSRSYVNWDLSRSDLKQRLREMIALMDTTRPTTIMLKARAMMADNGSGNGNGNGHVEEDEDDGVYDGLAASHPHRPHFTFQSGERDIMRMRVEAERVRHRELEARLAGYQRLHALVQWIQQRQAEAQAQAQAQAQVHDAQKSSRMGAGSIEGHHATSRSFLPSLEEMYVVEVIATLIDSGIDMAERQHAYDGEHKIIGNGQQWNQPSPRSWQQSHMMPGSGAQLSSVDERKEHKEKPPLFTINPIIHHIHPSHRHLHSIPSSSSISSASSTSSPPSHSTSTSSLRSMSSHQTLDLDSASPGSSTSAMRERLPPASFILLLLMLDPVLVRSCMKSKDKTATATANRYKGGVRSLLGVWGRMVGLMEIEVENGIRLVVGGGEKESMSKKLRKGVRHAAQVDMDDKQPLTLDRAASILSSLPTSDSVSSSFSTSLSLSGDSTTPLSSIMIQPVCLDALPPHHHSRLHSGVDGDDGISDAATSERLLRQTIRQLTLSSNQTVRREIGIGIANKMKMTSSNGSHQSRAQLPHQHQTRGRHSGNWRAAKHFAGGTIAPTTATALQRKHSPTSSQRAGHPSLPPLHSMQAHAPVSGNAEFDVAPSPPSSADGRARPSLSPSPPPHPQPQPAPQPPLSHN